MRGERELCDLLDRMGMTKNAKYKTILMHKQSTPTIHRGLQTAFSRNNREEPLEESMNQPRKIPEGIPRAIPLRIPGGINERITEALYGVISGGNPGEVLEGIQKMYF